MKITRDTIEQISKDNNIKTVDELLKYIDYEKFFKLVYEKSKELENGILRFRYKDKEEALNNYKRELYDIMISKGRYLNKENCVISEEVKDNVKYVCNYITKCDNQKYDPQLQTMICEWEDAENCVHCFKV